MLILYFFVGDTWETFVLLSDHYHLRVMMKDININLLTEFFYGNFNGNFIELKCTTLFFDRKPKNRGAVYQFHVVCFDGNGWAWVGFSPEKIQIPLCQEMALNGWNYELIHKHEKVVDSKLSIENDSNCATSHEIFKKILCFNFYDRSSTFFVICVIGLLPLQCTCILFSRRW